MSKIRHHIYCNTRKYSLFVILFLLSNTLVHSQTKVSFQWSKFQQVSKYSQALFLFKNNDGYGVVTKSNIGFKPNFSAFVIKYYNWNLELEDMQVITMHKYKEKLLQIWNYKNCIYFLTQVELPNQRLSARLRTVKTDSLGHRNISSQDIISLNKTHFTKNLDFHVSRKDSSISIWYPNPSEAADSRLSITVQSYSNEMLQTDKALIDLPGKAELSIVYRVENIDSGRFLIYAKEYSIRPIEKRGFTPNYKFVFYLSNPSNETLKYFEFKDENVYLEKGRIKWKEGILEAAGMFATKLEGPKMGIWFLKYDFYKQSYLLDTIEYFDQEVKSLPNNGFKTSMIRYSKLESFYIDYFIKLNSENRIIVSEQYFLLPASIGSSYTYNRFYGDILLLYLNKKGEIYNARRVIKAQQTFNNFGEYSSYYLERKDSVFRFFYNDNARNIEQRRFHHLVWHRHSSLNITEITEHTVAKFSLATYGQIDGIIQVRDMIEIEPNKYLVYAYNRKKAKLGIMKLE